MNAPGGELDRTGVVVLGHGSRSPEARLTLERIVSAIKTRRKELSVGKASLQFDAPTLCQAIDDMVEQGIERIIVAPFFLYRGVHLSEDIPREIEKVKERHPSIEIALAESIGDHPGVVDALLENLDEWAIQGISPGSASVETGSSRCSLNFELPSEIEKESFRRIESAIFLDHLNPREREVAKRIVHASGDLSLADRIVFKASAVDVGLEALRRGEAVIVDVMMLRSGIDERLTGKLGIDLVCAVSDERSRDEAKKRGSTRCAAGMRLSAWGQNGGIVAIGNSPTALFEVCKMIRRGETKPSLLIGMPVGFIGALESKELLLSLDIPAIAVRGTRGGSALAAAAVNAMLKLAAED